MSGAMSLLEGGGEVCQAHPLWKVHPRPERYASLKVLTYSGGHQSRRYASLHWFLLTARSIVRSEKFSGRNLQNMKKNLLQRGLQRAPAHNK